MVISLIGLLYSRKNSANDATKKTLNRFEEDLREFLNYVLGWYNKIFSFTNSLLYDAREGKLTAQKLNEYRRLLSEIRGSDEYYSKCNYFVWCTLEKYMEVEPFNEEGLRNKLKGLQENYETFETLVLYHKDSISTLLEAWKFASKEDRRWATKEIDIEIRQIKTIKDAVRDSLNISLPNS